MAKADWSIVTRENVIKAISDFLSERPEYPAPRSTFLVYAGKKLPAKHIRGMAYKVATGTEISKEDYAGGIETVRFFRRLGFEIFYIGSSKDAKTGDAAQRKAPVKGALPQPTESLAKEHSPNYKITIPSKGVIEQKNALQLLLNRMFSGDIVCERTFPWLKTPDAIDGEYIPLYKALAAYRGKTDFAKKNIPLRCDFVCESHKLIIEYDERQHFSQARKLSLEAYRSIPLCFDRESWIKACSDIQAKDNNPENRDEVRAFYDSTRDIEAAKHEYCLVRIMHGQIDFEQPNAQEQLAVLLSTTPVNMEQKHSDPHKSVCLKIAMYLQTAQHQNLSDFTKAMAAARASKAELLVFPENCWVPFHSMIENADIIDEADVNKIYDTCVDLSCDLGMAVVVSGIDKFGTIFSVFANATALKDETQCAIYLKHTATAFSPFELEDYHQVAETLFTPIWFKGYQLGLTICYDCNHPLFSRMYGVQGVDVILNSTGGNVIYDKWYKYNQARAIENRCYTLVTMGGDGEQGNSYVFGFNRNGKEIHPTLANIAATHTNEPGGVYLYDLTAEDHADGCDTSLNQLKTENKKQDFFIPVGNVTSILDKADAVEGNLFIYPHKDDNIVFCVVDGEGIFHAESFLPLLYSPKLSKFINKRYILICRYKGLTPDVFSSRLSVVLKVRAMENFCAVILESDSSNECYQTGRNKTAQVVKPVNGLYGLDLSRMSGPEAIWKNKGDYCKADWRTNYAWLAGECKRISNEKTTFEKVD